MKGLATTIFRFKWSVIIGYGLLGLISIYGLFSLKFSFDFEQLFPEGDPDLEFFKEFVADFEGDDSFLLMAVERPGGVFDSIFLNRVDSLTREALSWKYVRSVSSLTSFSEPVKTPFGYTSIPVLHIDDPSKYAADREKIMADDRFAGQLITRDATALVIALKTDDQMDLEASNELMAQVQQSVDALGLTDVRYLGRPFFQKAMVDMQHRELSTATVVSGILVSLVLILLFRRLAGVSVALLTIGLGLLLFLGFLSASGRELNILSALYPLLMIIVGTSDVVHLMTKYISELRSGKPKQEAMATTLRQIGVATFLTSITTAIGYLSLMTSRIGPVKDFGMNSAIGVMMAYFIAITFMVALLYLFPLDKIIKTDSYHQKWNGFLLKWYQFTIDKKKEIIIGSVLFLIISAIGISLISTNYKIIDNLPRGKKISNDYLFFEDKLTGFRPVEFAISTLDGSSIDNFNILSEVNKLESYLVSRPEINSVFSYTDLYKTLNKANHNNRIEYYSFPLEEKTYERYRKRASQMSKKSPHQLINDRGNKMRSMTRFDDLGADRVKVAGQEIDAWIAQNLNMDNLQIRQTGTGLILDKNSGYVLQSLLSGLTMALLVVSGLMMILFRDWRLLIISLIPNLFPLLFAGAMLGYLGIDMEAGVSIVFAITFGIAVDDTIHFLGKFKIMHDQGLSVEDSIRNTFLETGKAICLTTIILFFGFLVLLFSINPPSITIGILISVTLISAMVSDFMLIPILLRTLIKK